MGSFCQCCDYAGNESVGGLVGSYRFEGVLPSIPPPHLDAVLYPPNTHVVLLFRLESCAKHGGSAGAGAAAGSPLCRSPLSPVLNTYSLLYEA
jgi:hypothetical protein